MPKVAVPLKANGVLASRKISKNEPAVAICCYPTLTYSSRRPRWRAASQGDLHIANGILTVLSSYESINHASAVLWDLAADTNGRRRCRGSELHWADGHHHQNELRQENPFHLSITDTRSPIKFSTEIR